MTSHQKRFTAKKYTWQLAIMWQGVNRYTLKCQSVPEALREANKLFDVGGANNRLETITIRRIIQ